VFTIVTYLASFIQITYSFPITAFQTGIDIKCDGKVLTTDGTEKAVNLRKELQKNKIDVYGLAGKFDNCGGSGICGRCAVKVLEGGKNINPPSKNELNTLKLKNQPADTRLSCCARVTGPVTVKCLKP
jgi:ferredoxin